MQRYMKKQADITVNMRAIVVDWLTDFHMKMRLVPDTLYLAVNVMDRYLARVEITRDDFQLVAVTSLLIAAKYEEIYPPEIKDCVYITDRAYTKQKIIDTELDILTELRFNLTVPTAYPFLQRFLFITNATTTMEYAASYYLDRMLMEHEALQFRPSVVAATCVCLAINHPGIRENDGLDETPAPGVPNELVEYTGYAPELIHQTAEYVANTVDTTLHSSQHGQTLKTAKNKYSKARFSFVAEKYESPDAIDLVVSLDS